MGIRDVCPPCPAPNNKKNGHMHHAKQHHQGKTCGRQCVDCFAHSRVSDDTRALLERVLRARMALRGICRAVGGTLPWLVGCIVNGVASLPDHGNLQPLSCDPDGMRQRLEIEADAMARVVPKNANTYGMGLAMDGTTRQMLALHVGDRLRTSAKSWWAKMPTVYRQQATFAPDQSGRYDGVMPAARHKAITKKARTTHPIERWNNTRRHRVSRRVRSALSFSKTRAHPLGALTYCMCHDNLTRAAGASEHSMESTTEQRRSIPWERRHHTDAKAKRGG